MKTTQSEFKVGMVVKYKQPEFKVGMVVKKTNPATGEEQLRYYVTYITNSGKLHLELIQDGDEMRTTIICQADEVEPSWFTKKVEYEGEIVKAICFGRF